MYMYIYREIERERYMFTIAYTFELRPLPGSKCEACYVQRTAKTQAAYLALQSIRKSSFESQISELIAQTSNCTSGSTVDSSIVI